MAPDCNDAAVGLEEERGFAPAGLGERRASASPSRPSAFPGFGPRDLETRSAPAAMHDEVFSRLVESH